MSNSTANIKILVACHRDDVNVPDHPLLAPIQVGAARAKRRFAGMLHDDEGDNISQKNDRYCELTALYWAWKNLDADYVGLMHYRRYFSFTDERYDTNPFGDIDLECNDTATLDVLGYDEQNMRAIIEGAEVVAPEKGHFVNGMSMREQYCAAREQKPEDLECVLDILAERYPHMVNVANAYLDSPEGYFCNMFIMRRDLFDGYCAWLFDILAEHERRRDFWMYDPVSLRVSGYLAERLTGIYLTWLQEQGHTCTHLQRTLFQDVQRDPLPTPAFPGTDAVTLVLAANDFYVPYLSALLESIADNASPQRNYDVIVLNTDISARNQARLRAQVAAPNFSLRFFNARFYMRGREGLFLRGHFRIETYYRLLMQDILPGYSKALYLDSDMIVLDDIAKLYDTDVEGYLMAACLDADTAGLYNGFEPNKKHYMDNVLKMKNPYEYFQAGTILFNLDEFRRCHTVDELFAFAASYEWELLDQDVLNHFGEGRTKFVDMRWNVMMDWADIRIRDIIGIAPAPLVRKYLKAREDPAIVHYAGPDKPWEFPDADFAEHFWRYSRRTPFYELALKRMCTPRPEPEVPLTQKAKEAVWAAGVAVLPYETRRREVVGKLYRKARGRE